MINGIEVLQAIDTLVEEKNIDRNLIIGAIKEGIIKSYEKYIDPDAKIEVVFDEKTGQLEVYRLLNIVDKVEDEFSEILLESIVDENEEWKLGDIYWQIVDTEEFSRLAALQVAQILKQHLREAEKEIIYEKYISKKDNILIGTVDNIEENYYILKIVDHTFAILPKKNSIPNEKLRMGDKIKFYVEDVNKNKTFGQILASRVHVNFLVKLLEIEIPEIYEGVIEIKAIARISGQRSKVAVFCSDATIDPIGACVGNKGQRIQSVMNELAGEKIDIVRWDPNPYKFIMHALSPAKAISIMLNEETNEADIIVADEHYSLAIGRKGMTAKLTAKITKWKINIISFSEATAENMTIDWNGNLSEQQMLELQNKSEDSPYNRRSFTVYSSKKVINNNEEKKVIEEADNAINTDPIAVALDNDLSDETDNYEDELDAVNQEQDDVVSDNDSKSTPEAANGDEPSVNYDEYDEYYDD